LYLSSVFNHGKPENLTIMDHIVYLDIKTREMENLILGNKSMIIRGASGRKLPHGRVMTGDILYFVNNNEDGLIRARGVVSSVYCSGMLTEEESFRTIIMNQDKLQLPDTQFEKIAGKRYLTLIGLENIQKIEPFRFDQSSFINTDDWIPVGNIEENKFFDQGIISA
jgi:hypothetical protein